MPSRCRPTFLAAVLLVALPSSALAQDLVAGSGGAYVPPKPIQRPAPEYPRKELSAQSAGWVMVSFVIAPSGNVVDPMIEDSSGNAAIEEAVLKGVLRWTYEPALLDGKPVESAVTSTRIAMFIDGSNEASWDFKKTYREFSSSIEARNFPSAAGGLAKLEALPHINAYEDAWIWWARYRYLDSVQSTDEPAKHRALQRALGHEIDYLDPNLFVEAARRLYLIYANELDLSSAKHMFERLEKSKVGKRSSYHAAVVAALKPSYEKILEAVGAEQLFRMDASIGEYHYWVHEILRRSFAIDRLEGRLDAVDVRCERGMRRFRDISQNTLWSVPADWGQCSVYLSGEPGAKFSFLEYPLGFAPEGENK